MVTNVPDYRLKSEGLILLCESDTDRIDNAV